MRRLSGLAGWKWLLTTKERALLDGIVSETVTEHECICDYCDVKVGPTEPMRHADNCPVTIVRLFARKLVAARGGR